ncbi:MAG TPA: lamin tail domain-containing protein [Bacteroidales bacterium]|nr:lamin tail domain-containing protein [Bacteroidales bacterium]HPR11597.1 lamin tail domain-containing protein [Bacteroidales bacterium]
MKKVVLLLLLIPYPALCQISDDFESGTLNSWIEGTSGRWQADLTQSISGNYSLHHIFDNSSGSSDCIGLQLTNLHPFEGHTRWSFFVRHGSDPSSSNNWALFLMSDTDPGNFNNGAMVSGFAAGVNLSGYDDTLRIWKIIGGNVSSVAECPLNWQNDIGTDAPVHIMAERKHDGIWTLEVYSEEDSLIASGSGFDADQVNGNWLVLNYRYTSTRDRLLWLDNVMVDGVFYEDKIPPRITGTGVIGYQTLEIYFSEDVTRDILDPSLFSLNGDDMIPEEITSIRPGMISVRFPEPFLNKKTNTLKIKQLCDNSGNCTTDAETEFFPAWAEPGDVIITEIMADPLPQVSLPQEEYIEIFNRTPWEFDLTGWNLGTANQQYPLPPVSIKAGEYIVLCSQSCVNDFLPLGRTEGLNSFPAMTDAGRIIFLSDSSDNLIHGVEYSSGWYGNKLKENGGWSLEMTDTDFPFYCEGNWEASVSLQGGTPGRPNSSSRTNRDPVFTGLVNVFPAGPSSLDIMFSETVFGLKGEPGKVVVEGDAIKSVSVTDPLQRKFKAELAGPLFPGREYYLLITGDIRDFAGNEIRKRTFRFGLPEPAEKGDMVFNELLFNPLPDDVDYIEFVNVSEKTIDASRLWLASVSPTTGDTSAVSAVSEMPVCILPGGFYVPATDPSKVTERYFSSVEENIHSVQTLPSMPDDKGHLLLFNREMKILDEVIYSEKMHYPLLAGHEGISLEKIRPGLPSCESMNWHSASESSGWGTPGSGNSVFSLSPSAGAPVTLSSGRITPDNDGVEDVLVIDLDPVGVGNVVTITIFDERGGFVRRIKENFLAGERASIVWDGNGDDASLVRRGVYIILVEMFDASGKTSRWKRVCTVVR